MTLHCRQMRRVRVRPVPVVGVCPGSFIALDVPLCNPHPTPNPKQAAGHLRCAQSMVLEWCAIGEVTVTATQLASNSTVPILLKDWILLKDYIQRQNYHHLHQQTPKSDLDHLVRGYTNAHSAGVVLRSVCCCFGVNTLVLQLPALVHTWFRSSALLRQTRTSHEITHMISASENTNSTTKRRERPLGHGPPRYRTERVRVDNHPTGLMPIPA